MMIAVITSNPSIFSWVKKSVENKNCTVLYATGTSELLHLLNPAVSVQAVIWDLSGQMQEQLFLFEQITRQYPKVRFMVMAEEQECAGRERERLQRKIDVVCMVQNEVQVQQAISRFIDTLNVPEKFSEELNAQDIEICSGIIFKPHLHCLLKNGKLEPLPDKEFQLLMYFIKNQGRFVTTEQILHNIWDEYTGPETARQYIYKLRRKLKTDKHSFSLIFYLKGVGYTLVREENHYLTELARSYSTTAKVKKVNPLSSFPEPEKKCAMIQ
ncbi:winged helix-turn-helix domain-containing protein [Brevibacillus fulvus]|uniref:DNA-binding response OmpR family regulator n=1 Tax=Brevibacillus fulvus TaxID=1125967 RepID=A0A938XT97_9BACL|nr:helix-turn-helix domain-containing protein [Brevibacillus fulvus]MBM7589642.1 DNA-binding response OmpR family regulator [Brevibacillus fulvus]